MLALALGAAISDLSINQREFVFWDQDVTAASLFLGILIHAHIFIVVFRSHGNSEIFKLHPWRFVAVPIALYVLMNASMWILVSVSVLATFWDLYHDSHQVSLSWPILVGGTLFLGYYALAQWRLHQAGQKVSVQKTFLLVSTGLVSIYTWGFNSWGEAFFIMNVFHAVQYFGIVWATEKKNIVRTFRLSGRRFASAAALLLLIGSGTAYGYFVEAVDADINHLWALVLVMSIMHFWYDGFIWSVRKKQV